MVRIIVRKVIIIKILMIMPGMRSGGAERVMATLCNELSKRHQIRLFTLKSNDTDYYLSSSVEFLGGNVSNQNIFKSINVVVEQYKSWKPDIVLSFMTKANIIALLAKQKIGAQIPVIIAERANPYYAAKYLKILRKELYPLAEGAVFQTIEAQNYYHNILKCESSVLKNPLGPDFSVKPYRGERQKVIVTVGRLSKEKNQKLLIKSFAKIAKKYPDHKLEIYGDGPLKKELQQLINQKNINLQVKLMGRRNNIQEQIKNAELFVLPSNSEGMPNSLLEAMALGLPCIATDCPIGGPAAIIDNKVNGLLVPMNDLDAMAAAIELLINNRQMASEFGERATKVIQDFDTVNVCSEWEKYINKVMLKSGKEIKKSNAVNKRD